MAPETSRGVSSRLLTMKFMQRAIASNSAAPSPESDSRSTKKRKLDHASPTDRPSMGFDQASVDAAMQAQEAQRQAALLLHATGDTHWVLNTKIEKSASSKPIKVPRRIVNVGYGDIDWDNDLGGGGDLVAYGRMSTQQKKAKPTAKKSPIPGDEDSEEDESGYVDIGDESGHKSDGESDDSGGDLTPRRRKESGSQPQTSRCRSSASTRQKASEAKAKELRTRQAQEKGSGRERRNLDNL